jgi:hypothetical protein
LQDKKEHLESEKKMDTNDSALLLQVFSSVFEDFAFMFVEADDDPPGEDTTCCPCLLARISFTGREHKGVLEAAAPVSLCQELAENILGTDTDDLPDDAPQQAITEMLNVSCGYLLSKKFGVDEVFDLSIPETTPLDEQQWDQLAAKGKHLFLLVDESPMLVSMTVEA